MAGMAVVKEQGMVVAATAAIEEGATEAMATSRSQLAHIRQPLRDDEATP